MKKKSTKRADRPGIVGGGDRDNPEWTRGDFARSVPFSGLPPALQAALPSRARGLQRAPTKVPVSIRLSADVIKAFRASGAGWQTRVDEILRAHIK
jgi:uncharacterized protein (DUF4415 family)